MPYKTIKDLPDNVQMLPKGAKEIFLKVFNNAWQQYKDPEKRLPGSTQEEAAFRVAWSAVKKSYEKNANDRWVKIKP